MYFLIAVLASIENDIRSMSVLGGERETFSLPSSTPTVDCSGTNCSHDIETSSPSDLTGGIVAAICVPVVVIVTVVIIVIVTVLVIILCQRKRKK